MNKNSRGYTRHRLAPGFTPILIVVLLGLVAVVGYLALRPKTSPTEQSPATASENPIAEWKTYHNEKYGFEFKYPPRWKIYDFDNDKNYVATASYWYVKRLTFSSRDYKLTYSEGDFLTYRTEGGKLNFVIYKNSYETIDQILEQESLQGDIERIQVDNIEAIKVVNNSRAEINLVTIMNDVPGPVYINLSMNFDPNRRDEFQRIFDQILSTLLLDSGQ
ncbi:MAG: PsbP-related protein [Patescibacteria group bacterium]